MKRLAIIGGVLMAFLYTSCYEDKGNYEYHDINELTVNGVESRYDRDVDDSLRIVPIIEGTMYNDTSRFTYSWEIGSSVVSQSHDLNIQIDMTPGYKYSRYVVTDKETGIKTYKEFGVNVSSSTAGDVILVLSKYNGKAELSYLRLDKENANWAINYFESRNDYSLGNNPQRLTICYTESARNAPFVNRYGRVMVLADNVLQMVDKSTLMIDTLNQVLTADDYLSQAVYPKPEIDGYKSEFAAEGISLWRSNAYGSGSQQSNNFIEISNGHLFAAASLAPSIWTTSYYYNVSTPYEKGYLSPFGYWDDMSDTPNNNLKQMGYSLGNFIVFDRVHGRFAFADSYGASIRSIEEADVKAFPGYTMRWGAATNRPNNGSIAVIENGSESRIVMLADGTSSSNRATKKLVGDISGGNIITGKSSFYMLKYGDNLFFSNERGIYRYNILNIASKVAPRESDKVFDLAKAGYDNSAVITDIFVSRTEKTMLVAVSRYGSDIDGTGEPKGDLLWFNLDASSGRLEYNAEKSYRGISGIPVDVQVKYQTHYRNGLNFNGVLMDNI